LKIFKKYFLVAERERPLPRICQCQNGGFCKEDDNGGVICDCPVDFNGKFCEKFLGQAFGGGGNSTAAILIPIIILALMGAAVGSWFVIKKRPL
jgi:low density lipoprotein-related protein 2